MIKIQERSKCCGCNACGDICPKQAISFKVDKEGFWYPEVNNQKCIDIQTQAEAVCELFGGKKEEIKVIGIRHGEKMYETLLTKGEAAKAIDMVNFYAVPADNRDLNYDKYFKEGDVKRALIDEFNSNNTRILNLEETKEKITSLMYIQNELNGIPNLV